jgi:Flp pilus assembly pilin Flp
MWVRSTVNRNRIASFMTPGSGRLIEMWDGDLGPGNNRPAWTPLREDPPQTQDNKGEIDDGYEMFRSGIISLTRCASDRPVRSISKDRITILSKPVYYWRGGETKDQLNRIGGVKAVKQVRQFVREEQGQDLVEYTLLLAFVCLASAALFIGAGKSMANIWVDTNLIVTNAGQVANGATAS